MTDELDGPLDPFLVEEAARWPEEIYEPEAGERINALLRGYQDPEEDWLVTGWVLLTQWSRPGGADSIVASTVSPDLDWARTLGIVRGGQLKLEREYVSTDDEED